VSRSGIARVRHHVNPLKASFSRPASGLELPAGAEVEVELGCADAQFLFERARRRPEGTYVGLEIREELVRWVNRTAAAAGLPVRAVFAHANQHLRDLFAPGQVARLFVNFPDPWFKRRHHNRRVVDARLVDDVCRLLRPGGELLFQSDVWDVALDALAALERPPELENRAGEWSFWKDGPPYGVRSRREDACLAEGRPVWRIWYTRRMPP